MRGPGVRVQASAGRSGASARGENRASSRGSLGNYAVLLSRESPWLLPRIDGDRRMNRPRLLFHQKQPSVIETTSLAFPRWIDFPHQSLVTLLNGLSGKLRAVSAALPGRGMIAIPVPRALAYRCRKCAGFRASSLESRPGSLARQPLSRPFRAWGLSAIAAPGLHPGLCCHAPSGLHGGLSITVSRSPGLPSAAPLGRGHSKDIRGRPLNGLSRP